MNNINYCFFLYSPQLARREQAALVLVVGARWVESEAVPVEVVQLDAMELLLVGDPLVVVVAADRHPMIVPELVTDMARQVLPLL